MGPLDQEQSPAGNRTFLLVAASTAVLTVLGVAARVAVTARYPYGGGHGLAALAIVGAALLSAALLAPLAGTRVARRPEPGVDMAHFLAQGAGLGYLLTFFGILIPGYAAFYREIAASPAAYLWLPPLTGTVAGFAGAILATVVRLVQMLLLPK